MIVCLPDAPHTSKLHKDRPPGSLLVCPAPSVSWPHRIASGQLCGRKFSSNVTDGRSLISWPDNPITSQDSPVCPWAALVGKLFLTLGKNLLSYNLHSLCTAILWVQVEWKLPYRQSFKYLKPAVVCLLNASLGSAPLILSAVPPGAKKGRTLTSQSLMQAPQRWRWPQAAKESRGTATVQS